VKEHFKKTILEMESPIDASKKVFFVKMRKKKKHYISNYESMMSKEHKNCPKKTCHNKSSLGHTSMASL
jgi:hypothetical protein